MKLISKCFALALYALVASLSLAFAFSPSGPLFEQQHRRNSHLFRLHEAPGSIFTYSAAENDEMEELIVSLSHEATDSCRRDRLASVFAQALAKPNGAPHRFCYLFDQTLIVVGDRVKIKAELKAREILEAAKSDPSSSSPLISEESNDKDQGLDAAGPELTAPIRTEEELQLWALVDMMVQSKTIVKKARSAGEVEF